MRTAMGSNMSPTERSRGGRECPMRLTGDSASPGGREKRGLLTHFPVPWVSTGRRNGSFTSQEEERPEVFVV